MSDELKAWLNDKTYLMDILSDMGVDVVEVVRCKECKNWDAENHYCNIRDSFGWDYKPTDYCSYGEKK